MSDSSQKTAPTGSGRRWLIHISAWAQLALSIALASTACYLYCLHRPTAKSEIFSSSAALLNDYAEALTTQRLVYEGLYGSLPPLRSNIQSIGEFSADLEQLAEKLLVLSKLQIPLVNTTPFASLASPARRLMDLAANNQEAMAAADRGLAAFDDDAHQQLLDLLDNTVLELQQNASRLQEQGQKALISMRLLLAFCIIIALLFSLNAGAMLAQNKPGALSSSCAKPDNDRQAPTP
jgi:hypothetical protein